MENEVKEVKQERLDDITKKEIEQKLEEIKSRKATFKFTQKVKEWLTILGFILSVLGATGYIITLLIIVMGVKDMDFEFIGKDGLFFIISLSFGLFIRIGFYIQGIIYAKQENLDILKEYNELIAVKNKEKKFRSFEFKMTIQVISQIFSQVAFFFLTSVGLIMLAGFEGMNNWIYFFNGISNIFMFAGFGMLGLNKTYENYLGIKIPTIKQKIREMKKEQ